MHVSYCCLTSFEKCTYNLSNKIFYVIYFNQISQHMTLKKEKEKTKGKESEKIKSDREKKYKK
jgi:hypothetical protein